MLSAEDFNALSTRSKRKVMNEWEYGIKRSYRIDAAEHRKWYIDIPGYYGQPSFEDTRRSVSPLMPLSPRPLSMLRLSSPAPSLSDLHTPMSIDRDSVRGALVLRTYDKYSEDESYKHKADRNSGHLNAMFGEVCDKIKDLISEQIAVVTDRLEKEPLVFLRILNRAPHLTYARQSSS